ncbi:hypothetical protein ACIG0C_25305 [Kitasatospora aureofaciens]|uniref:DUF998 domain-containing protein n=2 Tax=Kitasatospora aureofaciens TaxID=1894 RepID=A0A1E7N6Z8_KITAU|nr:hypothetical protein [Kitasatospora aureofaciens]ARF82246.1 hypothetical protein B6264_28225 [Kitasatospora aureofaciens]OEV36449.1 hypothetical protein HS99_0029380 [Kitasatospora aureofaciens]GGU71617.1 hypothetical protein GCM10010502_24320 [Kitasatospora aureofaciens]
MSDDRSVRRTTDPEQTVQDERTVSFLRFGVGAIGVLLPPALPLGNWLADEVTGRSTDGFWPASMSAAYYTGTRNVFVGALCALGVFLVCYRFDRRDDRWSTAAGLFALGVALCPPAPQDPTGLQRTVGVFHLVFAALLFVMLALFCLYSFRNPRSTQPARVGAAYLAAGVLILVALVAAAVAGLSGFGADWAVRPMYLCEWVATWAFGAAWIGAAVELAAGRGGRAGSGALPRQAVGLEVRGPEASQT